MNPITIVFLAVISVAIFATSRKNAPLPVLCGICYLTMGQGIDIGPFSFHAYRVILLIALVRVFAKGEHHSYQCNPIDKLVWLWAAWTFIASLFHEYTPGSGPVFALGNMFNILSAYFIFRIWCKNLDEVLSLVKFVAIVLVPIAIEMLNEKLTGTNFFSFLGGVSEYTMVREGSLRAQGPFRHPILAGTVGATCVPLMIGLWHQNKKIATMGMAAGVTMTFASASSGPIISLAAGFGCILAWRYRHLTMRIFWSFTTLYILVDLISSRPGYHVFVEKLAVVGGSTAYYRARLLDAAFKHFDEWWLIGTDYTRHWIGPGMGSVINGNHMDITNYYLGMGVNAGLPAILIVFLILWKCLKATNYYVNQPTTAENYHKQFSIWCFGASLAAHALSSFSISYFDQSVVFFWLSVAVLVSYTYGNTESDEHVGNDETTDRPQPRSGYRQPA